jgi:heptosyltransferase-1
MNILIVRLGALGDVVHAIPAAAALRRALPDARIDWIVEARHRSILDLVTIVDRVIAIESRNVSGWINAVRQLRETRYDVALDFQGLMKSAVFARASGAARVVGFSIWHLREKAARSLYSETDDALEGEEGHVILKNLHLLRVLGIESAAIEFPLARVESRAAAEVGRMFDGQRFGIINPGAAWPNKRWPPSAFGEVAAFLQEVRGMPSIVLWGPDERALAESVVEASGGTARLAPPTTVVDLVELSRAATIVVSGDTGPLHIAAAVGTPVVALYGPTNPARNGPWSADDQVVSRFESCGCHYERTCRQPEWCLRALPVAEVTAAIQQRLSSSALHSERDRPSDV